MTEHDFPPAWAVLAPASPARLGSLLRGYWSAHHAGLEDVLPIPRVVEGTGAYAAAVDRSPGARTAEAVPLARALSGQVDGTVYLLDLGEDREAPRAWRRGEPAAAPEQNAHVLAAELGVALPLAPRFPAAPSPGGGLVLVEGASEPEVRAAVEPLERPGPIRFSVELGERGVLVRRGGLTTFAYDLSEALPGRTVWALEWDAGRFTCAEARDGEMVAFFAHPGATDAERANLPVVDQVRGRRDPAEIARALGVPEGGA
jgi:hypothetical protein